MKEYYILYGHGEPMAFYRLNAAGVYESILQQRSDLIRSEVLPGFQSRLADLFAQPALNNEHNKLSNERTWEAEAEIAYLKNLLASKDSK